MLLVLTFAMQTTAQIQFDRIHPTSPLVSNIADIRFASDGTVLAFDVDNDGDLDLMVTGRFRATIFMETNLYLNDGNGNFTTSNFSYNGGFRESEGVVLDANNDGFQDFIFTGRVSNQEAKTILFLNNGTGNFSEANLGLPGLYESSITTGNFDASPGIDFYLTGEDENGTIFNALYLNDGSGGFTPSANTGIPATYEGGVTSIDLNMDGYTDLAVSGNTANGRHTAIYINDQTGGFLIEGSSLEQVKQGKVSFTDYDGDGDADLLSTGFNNSNVQTVQIYENNGSGFNQVNPITFPQLGIYGSALRGLDYDQDGDMDLILNHSGPSGGIYYFENNGTNQFTQSFFDPYPIKSGELVYADWDGDQDLDLYKSSGQGLQNSGVYINDAGEYKAVTGNVVSTVGQISSAHRPGATSLDLNGDSFEDLIIIGGEDQDASFHVYAATGAPGQFVELPQPAVPIFGDASFAVGDVDGDQDDDVFIMGFVNLQPTLNLFINDGNGTLSLSSQNFGGTPANTAQFFDFDKDGDLDLLYNTLRPSSSDHELKVYLNDGSGNFTASTEDITFIHDKFIAAYLDADSIPDLYAYPAPSPNGFGGCKVQFGEYTNGALVFNDSVDLLNMQVETTSLADLDLDGTLDILLQGTIVNNQTPRTQIYFNQGNRTFDSDFSQLTHARLGSLDAIDLDGDDDLDIVQCYSLSFSFDGKIKVYENNGAGEFTETLNHGLEGFNRNFVVPNNADGTLNLLFNGYNEDGQLRSWYFGNESTNLCEQVQSLVSISANSSKLVSNYPDADYYQWLDCSGPLVAIPGENDSELILNQLSGSYALVIAKNGCRDTSECFEFDLTGLNSLEDQKTFVLFPNPATETFNLVFETPLTGTMHLYDSQGKLLIQAPFHQENSLEVTAILEPGFYVVKIETAGGIRTGRLLVE